MAWSPWSIALPSPPAASPTTMMPSHARRAEDEALDHDSPIEELFEDQLTCADLIVLNKTDLLDGAGIASVRAEVASRTHRKPTMIEARNGEVSAAILLGLGVGTEGDIANRKSHHELEHEDGAPHDHDEFDSFVVDLGPIAEPVTFIERLKTVIGQHDVLRLKGFVDVPGKTDAPAGPGGRQPHRPLFRPRLGAGRGARHAGWW